MGNTKGRRRTRPPLGRRIGRLPAGRAALAAVAVVSMLAVGQGPSAAVGPAPSTEAAPATFTTGPAPSVPGSAPTTTTGYTPVVGEFTFDGRADELWYGASRSEVIWKGSAANTFSSLASAQQARSVQPLSGDFTGDGVSDVFWYAPGSGAEALWERTSPTTFAGGAARSVAGTYRPVLGDFDDDGRTDIYWYAPGSGADSLWRTTSDKTFTSTATRSQPGTFTPLVGDFNADGRDDIFWYAAGGTAEQLWLGGPAGAFTSATARAVSGTYTPVTGDFDGNGYADIFFYSPGTGAESLWLGGPTGLVNGTAKAVNGTYVPVALDVNGDTCTDIHWYAPGSAPDALFVGSRGGSPCEPCPQLPGLDLWVFDDESGTHRVDQAVNWDHDDNSNVGVPGELTGVGDTDDHICIPEGKTAAIEDGVYLKAQVLQSAGTLTQTPGAILDLQGDPVTRPSTVKDWTMQGSLMGRGKVTVVGTMHWTSTIFGASTMTTRRTLPGSPYDPAVSPPLTVPPDPGRTVIAPNATLLIDGKGVNFWDKRIIDNFGTTRLVDSAAYIAADYGTTFNNSGTFEFQGDGDYVEGYSQPAPTRSAFVNSGLVHKTAGTGLSVIAATYSAPGGAAKVSSGSLSIFGDGISATVAPTAVTAATFGIGGCGSDPTCLAAATDASDPVAAALTLPAGTSPSTVDISEAPAELNVRGFPVDLTVPGETATAANPMVFRMQFDSSALQPGDTPALLKVYHGAVLVPDCVVGPAVPQCVQSKTLVSGDLVVVVRTDSNGRWKLRL